MLSIKLYSFSNQTHYPAWPTSSLEIGVVPLFHQTSQFCSQGSTTFLHIQLGVLGSVNKKQRLSSVVIHDGFVLVPWPWHSINESCHPMYYWLARKAKNISNTTKIGLYIGPGLTWTINVYVKTLDSLVPVEDNQLASVRITSRSKCIIPTILWHDAIELKAEESSHKILDNKGARQITPNSCEELSVLG